MDLLIGEEEVEVSARLIVATVFVAAAEFLAFSMRAPDNPHGWPVWVLVIALALATQGVRMVWVELRDPWGGDRG